MLKSMMMPLMMFLAVGASSCGSIQRKIICNDIREHEIKPHQMCDISFSKNRCRCREFDFNSWTELSEPVNYPIEQCEGIGGFFLEDIALDVRPQIRALHTIKGNLCPQR